MEIRGNTNTGKTVTRVTNLLSKTSALFFLTIIFYRVEKEREVGPKSRFTRGEYGGSYLALKPTRF